MNYKVGDIVKIKSLDWYNANRNEYGNVNVNNIPFNVDMAKYCGRETIISRVNKENNEYSIILDNGEWIWADAMFEENFKDLETREIFIPDGWEFDRVDKNKIIIKEEENRFPKTWEECYKLLGEGDFIDTNSSIMSVSGTDRCNDFKSFRNVAPTGLAKPILALCQLLVCREVYRQGWKPDWEECTDKYIIECDESKIVAGEDLVTGRLLSFQSAEVRDQFLENFRDLIEEAKELI